MQNKKYMIIYSYSRYLPIENQLSHFLTLNYTLTYNYILKFQVSNEANSSDEGHKDIEEVINISCEDVADNIVTVFKGVQNDAFGVDKTKYAEVGQAVSKKLSELNSYDAAQLSQKILQILAEYDENNPMNPNNL